MMRSTTLQKDIRAWQHEARTTLGLLHAPCPWCHRRTLRHHASPDHVECTGLGCTYFSYFGGREVIRAS